MLKRELARKESMPNTGVVVLAVDTGVVVIVVAVSVVLVLLIATVSMRGRQRRGAQRHGEDRRQLDEAAEERASRAQHERDVAREDGENALLFGAEIKAEIEPAKEASERAPEPETLNLWTGR
jgi:hypothetical protein